MMLWGRSPERLEAIASDLKVRSVPEVKTRAFDFNELSAHKAAFDDSVQQLGEIDLAIIAHGTLGDQKSCERDFNQTMAELNSNCVSTLSFLTMIANYFEPRKSGCIVAISSVAGDRGRQSNYVYGTAKAAVTTFLQGLRNRLNKSNVRVITVKPGFVDTPMTSHVRKKFLFASPEKVADDVVDAMSYGRPVVYTPWFWRYIMGMIRLIPEPIFCRLRL
jgi:short-subunit dehydrogenase